MTTTFCNSGSVLIKLGKNRDFDLSGCTVLAFNGDDYAIDEWIWQAEALINNMCRYNFITNYSSLQSGTKLILQEVASNLAAIYGISFNMATYSSRVEAEDMINIYRDGALRGLSILRDKKTQDFINGS